MQQRYYDPQIGRFLSVDPVTADGNTGGNFNRYWYANNNPYRFTDPDGRLAGGNEPRPGETFEDRVRRREEGPCGSMNPICLAGGQQPKPQGRPSSSGNHRSAPVKKVDKKKWGVAAEVTPGNKVSVDSTGGIIVQPRSIAWPPTFQFGYKVSQRPLEATGRPEAVVATPQWFTPEFYSSGLTGGREDGGMQFFAPSGPSGNRWFVEYPAQESTHDNTADSSLIIYTPLLP